MDDLIAFLNARLDDDHWEAFKFHNDSEWSADMLARLFNHNESDPVIHHLARYDPARVLREVAAKRAIIGLHRPSFSPADGDYTGIDCMEDDDSWPCQTLHHVAAIWSDHPDYRAEWAP
jgi:hypothetical protein